MILVIYVSACRDFTLCKSVFPLRMPWGGAVLHKVKTLQQWGIYAMLFHCDFYVFLANLGDYDRAGLSGEGCCAVDGGGVAEGLAIYAIEADLLVVVETGDGDETTGRLDGDATGFN